MGLAEALIRIEGPDSHWGSSAQDRLCALIIYSRLTGEGGGSLGHVRAMLGKPANQFVEMALDMIEVGIRQDIEELGIKAGRFCDLTPDNKELNSIISTASPQTRWLDSRQMKADLARGSFDFERMKREKITVYVNLPANRLGSHSSYLRVVLTAFLQSMLRDVRESQVPILVMLEEAAQIGELPILRDSIALLRGYGVKVWSLYQDVPQHKAVLGGGDRYESAAANSGVMLAMAPQDMTTAEMLSRQSGQTTANVLGYSAPAAAFWGEPAESSISLTSAAVPGLQPIELMQMDEGFAVMFSHKTKGHVFGCVPDPSEVESFDQILRSFAGVT